MHKKHFRRSSMDAIRGFPNGESVYEKYLILERWLLKYFYLRNYFPWKIFEDN